MLLLLWNVRISTGHLTTGGGHIMGGAKCGGVRQRIIGGGGGGVMTGAGGRIGIYGLGEGDLDPCQ